jgi:DNA-binding LytR/AlgR family response regulator
MGLKIVVVEDEFSILLDITRRLERMGFEVLGSALNYEEALVQLLEHKPDVLLLDINLNAEKSGIDIAKKVKENFPVPVVFLTASSDKTTFDEALATNPMGFIVKPFKDEDLRNNIDLAYQKFNLKTEEIKEVETKKNDQDVFLKHNNSFEKINLGEIMYLEAMDNYTKIHATSKRFIISNPLKNVLLQLPENQFYRIHKSYVVSTEHIKSVDNSSINLKSGEIIPIGKTFKTDFFKQMNIID